MDINIKSPICWSSATMLHLAIKSLYSYFSFEARDEPGDTLLAPAKSHRETQGSYDYKTSHFEKIITQENIIANYSFITYIFFLETSVH